MGIRETLEEKRAEILRIAENHGAHTLRVFGSVARGERLSAGNLDLLVEMNAATSLLDLIALKQDLEDLLSCKVDVVTAPALSPYIRDAVIQEAVPL